MNFKRRLEPVFFAVVLALLVVLANSTNALADDDFCTGSLGAITVSNLHVPQNASCTLNGTIVNGNIIVGNNATLHAYEVEVNGNIQAANAARVNVYAGSSVNGKIQLTHSSAADIQSVDIQGDLHFNQNDLFLNVANNTITGNLQAFGNTGGLSITGNTIDGNLQCNDNSPPPTGADNRVKGNMEGQCAGLGQQPPPSPTQTSSPPPTQTSPPPTQTSPSPTQTSIPPTQTSPPPTQTSIPPTQTSPPPTQTQPASTQATLVAHNDAYTLTGDQISVPAPGILENDQVSGIDAVEVVLVRQPQYGTVTLGQQGDFVYQVQGGYFGEDSFDYLLRSAGAESNPASVRLTISDQEAPSVRWVTPVLAGQRYDLLEGQQVNLEVGASDNGSIKQVTFLRWDAVSEQYINLGNLLQPPFQITISASTLNPGWNQVFVYAEDMAGNRSEYAYIWLYRVIKGRIYLPFLRN